jgi:hypothetical protein
MASPTRSTAQLTVRRSGVEAPAGADAGCYRGLRDAFDKPLPRIGLIVALLTLPPPIRSGSRLLR